MSDLLENTAGFCLSPSCHKCYCKIIDNHGFIWRERVCTSQESESFWDIGLHDMCPTEIAKDLCIVREILVRLFENGHRAIEFSLRSCDIPIEIHASTRLRMEYAGYLENLICLLEIILEEIDICEFLIESIVVSMCLQRLECSTTSSSIIIRLLE